MPAIRDLHDQVERLGRNVVKGGRGAIELAYMRGFQGGYEQAINDHESGCMDRENAFRPSRSTS